MSTTITTPYWNTAVRITASPDIASGDIIDVTAVTGGTTSDVTINPGGTYNVASGVSQFSFTVTSGGITGSAGTIVIYAGRKRVIIPQ